MRKRRETPEPWMSAMERAGIGSLQQLAARTGLSVATVVRLVHGEGESSDATLAAVAGVLRHADARHVAEWAGATWRSRPELPDAARKLTPKQWRAVERLIDAMADPGHVEPVTEGQEHAPPIEPRDHLRVARSRTTTRTNRDKGRER